MTMMERFTRADSRVSYRLPFPDYPSNARSFVHLDAKLLPYWHALFDVCPRLLKLDPPEGLEIFRQFMTWAYGCQLALDWTFHLGVCRWLLTSDYRELIEPEHIEAMMLAAAARWVASDDSPAIGIVLGWRGGSEHVSTGNRGFARVPARLPPKRKSCRRRPGTSPGARCRARPATGFAAGCACHDCDRPPQQDGLVVPAPTSHAAVAGCDERNAASAEAGASGWGRLSQLSACRVPRTLCLPRARAASTGGSGHRD
jgi:uncharacterized repeat protein (TIGR04061 family)